ncbi:unnamed protein product [Cunninghamella echinulata]
MPLASMLETNKPFVFASHSNGSSTELSSTSTAPTATITSTTNSNNNSSALPHSPHTTNAKLSSSTTEPNPYYSSSIPNDYESYNEETRHQQQQQQQSLNNNTLPSTFTNDTTSEALLDSHNNQGQANRANGYIYALKKVSSYPSNSQLPSPGTPTSVSSMSNTTSIKSITTSLPPVSSTLTSTSTNNISAPPVIQRHTFNTSLSTHHQPPPIQQQLRHQDTSLSLPPPPQPTSHGLHSRQVFHTMDPLHNNIKMEESSLLNSSHILHSSSSIAHSTIIPPPPTKQATVSSISTSQDEEGDSGYIDTNASDNRRVKRRKELNQRIELLNNDFLQNKERIFTEKLLMIQNEINQAHNFTHRKYKEGLLLLESIRQKAINDSRLFRDYQTEVTDRQFTLEIHQAEEEYMAEKHEVREKLFAVLEEKRRKLKEDKDNCDLSYDVVLETQTRMNKRSLRKRGMDNGDNKTNRRKQVSDILFYL